MRASAGCSMPACALLDKSTLNRYNFSSCCFAPGLLCYKQNAWLPVLSKWEYGSLFINAELGRGPMKSGRSIPPFLMKDGFNLPIPYFMRNGGMPDTAGRRQMGSEGGKLVGRKTDCYLWLHSQPVWVQGPKLHRGFTNFGWLFLLFVQLICCFAGVNIPDCQCFGWVLLMKLWVSCALVWPGVIVFDLVNGPRVIVNARSPESTSMRCSNPRLGTDQHGTRNHGTSGEPY